MSLGDRRRRLNDVQVSVARALHGAGFGYRRLARMYYVHRSTIAAAITGRTWKTTRAA